MAFIENGKTYTLQNTVTGKMLNLYGGNTTNGTNVCQYSADGSNEQKWTAIDNKLYTYCSSTKCLDRYNLPSSNNHNNADIWTASSSEDANQKVYFGTFGPSNMIRLEGTNLYLTASLDYESDSYMNTYGNTNTCKAPNATGNVYWKEVTDFDSPDVYLSCWSATEIGNSSSGGGNTGYSRNYAIYPCTDMKINENAFDEIHQDYSDPSANFRDFPIDEVCTGYGNSYMYCPCDAMEVVKIYGVGNEDKTNTIWLRSTTPVVMPSGTDYLVMMVMHPEDDQLSSIQEGHIFTRGEPMFCEGSDGGKSTGPHFHISVGKGNKVNGYNWWRQNSNGAWVLYTTGGTIEIQDAFYLDPDFTTVRNSNGINFTNVPE